jgi:hypothetical protein
MERTIRINHINYQVQRVHRDGQSIQELLQSTLFQEANQILPLTEKPLRTYNKIVDRPDQRRF